MYRYMYMYMYVNTYKKLGLFFGGAGGLICLFFSESASVSFGFFVLDFEILSVFLGFSVSKERRGNWEKFKNNDKRKRIWIF